MERQQWADYSKGIAIVLVVLCHAINGLETAGLFEPNYLWLYFDKLAYTFMVPVFFTLAGYFAKESQARRGLKNFSIGLLKTIVYPYFIWSAIQILLMIVTGASNAKPTFLTIFLLPVVAYAQFWFLYALFLCYVLDIALSISRVTQSYRFLLAILMLVVGESVTISWAPGYWLLSYYIYFIVGEVLPLKALKQRSSMLLLSTNFVAFILLNYLFIHNASFGSSLRVIGALVGILVVIISSVLLERSNKVVWLRILGIFSLEIYCLHTIASAASRYFIQKFLGSHNFLLLSFSGVLIGILLPLLIAILNNRYKLRLFRLS